MPDNPRYVDKTYSLEDTDWQNAFGEPDGRPAHLLRQDALSELDKVQSPAYHSLKQNFKEIDLDADGFLNPDEIGFAARKDPDLKDLADSKRFQWDMKRLVKDGKNDSRGISASDIEAFGALEIAANHAKNDPGELKLAAEFLDKYFQRLSREKEGLITKEDLKELIVDPSLKFDFRQKFLLVERYFDAISEQHRERLLKIKEHEGITQNDLRTLIKNGGRVLRK